MEFIMRRIMEGELWSVMLMLEIYPAKILAGAGITDYFIDIEEKTVYLCEGGLEKIAAFFDEKLHLGVTAVNKYGWYYKAPEWGKKHDS